MNSRTDVNFLVLCSNRWMMYMIILISEIKIILPNRNAIGHEGKNITEIVEEITVEAEEEMQMNNTPENQILDFAKEHGAFHRKDAELALGISQATCGRLLKRMVSNGLIVQHGKGKATYYALP